MDAAAFIGPIPERYLAAGGFELQNEAAAVDRALAEDDSNGS